MNNALTRQVEQIHGAMKRLQDVEAVAGGLDRLASEGLIRRPVSVHVWFDFELPRLAARWHQNGDTCLVTYRSDGVACVDEHLLGSEHVVDLLHRINPASDTTQASSCDPDVN